MTTLQITQEELTYRNSNQAILASFTFYLISKSYVNTIPELYGIWSELNPNPLIMICSSKTRITFFS